MLDRIIDPRPIEVKVDLSGIDAHPPTKRGAQNTRPLQMDFLRGTLPALVFDQWVEPETGEVRELCVPPLHYIEPIFGKMEEVDGLKTPGYTHGGVLPCGAKVYWDPERPSQRILLNFGGQALAELGMNPVELLRKLSEFDFHVTRFDWALDDRDGLLDLEGIKAKLQAGDVVTRFKDYGQYESGKIGDNGQDTGKTVHIGTRSSESYIRIYDKAIERGLAGEHWIRFEGEFKKRKAQKLCADILAKAQEGGDQAVAEHILGVFYGLIDFKEPDQSDTNKSRWQTCKWYKKFLDASEKFTVTVGQAEATLERAKGWVQKQVAITLAMLNEVEQGFLETVIDDAKSRMKTSHQLKLERWRAEYERGTGGMVKRAAAALG